MFFITTILYYSLFSHLFIYVCVCVAEVEDTVTSDHHKLAHGSWLSEPIRTAGVDGLATCCMMSAIMLICVCVCSCAFFYFYLCEDHFEI